MREVRFHIHRKSTFAGALLPYRMYTLTVSTSEQYATENHWMQTFPKQAFIILRMIFCLRETL